MDPETSAEHEALFAKYPHFRKVFETGIESHDGREAALLSHILSLPASTISSFAQEGGPQKLLDVIDDFSAKKEFMISIGPHKASLISKLIEESKPRTILELGGYLGYSAILFASTMRDANSGSTASLHVYSLELSSEFASIARRLIALCNLSHIITVVVGSSSETLPTIPSLLKSQGRLDAGIDLLFLDHHEPLYLPDFQLCSSLGLLQSGSTVVADNVLRPGAPEYRAYMRSLDGWSSQGVRGLIQPGDFEDKLEVSYRK